MRPNLTMALTLALALGAVSPVAAQPAIPSAAQAAAQAGAKPITVESYYRVKWGSMDEFLRLYERNELALLEEMKRQGLIVALSFDQPFTHLAAGPRWDFRARITYRDAAGAVETGGYYDKAFAAARAQLIPDKKRWEAEQAKRLGLLDDHWDVVVDPVTFKD